MNIKHSRNYYTKEELQYMVNQDVDVMVQTPDHTSWTLRKFHIEGVIHDDWVYGKTEDNSTTGRPYFILYTHVVSAPVYDRLKDTKLFQIATA